MFIIFAVIAVGFVILILCSAHTKVPDHVTGAARLFYRCAAYITTLLPEKGPWPDVEVTVHALAILAVGSILAVGVTILQGIGGQGEITSLEREGVNGNAYWETLQVRREDGKAVDFTVEVLNREFTKEEVQEWLKSGEQKLDEIIAGENVSLEHVEKPLNLIQKLPESPVSISWISSAPQILDWEGKLGEHLSERGTRVTLYATLTCQDETREYEKTVTVYPERKAGEEAWEQELAKTLEGLNENREDARFYLPQKIGQEEVVWQKETKRAGGIVLIIAILLSITWALGKSQEQKQKEQKKKEQMMMDYPDILNKFILLLSAGMNTRKAFAKVALDYRKSKSTQGANPSKREAYEALAAVYQEMEQGVPEAEAYMHLGIRCQLPAYKTFSTLLVQNLRKGNAEILEIMEREAVSAFENRKRQAKVMGEQAGTKLLVPMVLMLVLVFVILLVPAGMSFL